MNVVKSRLHATQAKIHEVNNVKDSYQLGTAKITIEGNGVGTLITI